ncbi:uncharacterized protein LOC143498892 isoform X3 [Brachyhypopomus gauderio]
MRGASTAVGAAPRSIDHTTATPGCRIRCIHPQGGLQMLACGQLQTFIILKWIMKHRPEMPTMIKRYLSRSDPDVTLLNGSRDDPRRAALNLSVRARRKLEPPLLDL